MRIQELDTTYRAQVNTIIRDEWGGPMMVTLGVCYDTNNLPGLVAVNADGLLRGMLLFRMIGTDCEISVLQALDKNQGIGTSLLNTVATKARSNGCKRLWLVTTNDNTPAIRFYQRYGFSLTAVHLGALEAARALKPEMPLYGIDSIPLLHEFEFTLDL